MPGGRDAAQARRARSWGAFVAIQAGARWRCIDFGVGVADSAVERESQERCCSISMAMSRSRLLSNASGRCPAAYMRAAQIDAADRDDYQTMFANHAGAVAAPTAALHFTDRLWRSSTSAASAAKRGPSTRRGQFLRSRSTIRRYRSMPNGPDRPGCGRPPQRRAKSGGG